MDATPGLPSRPDTTVAHSLRLTGLCKTYGALAAVDNVSLDIPRGEFLTLLGPSGSGKTTLLMMIAGFVPPTRGDIHVDARRITGLAPEQRNFGMVFQGYALFPHMTVAQNIAYPLRARGMSRALITEKLRAVLAMVRLTGFDDRLPRQLSGGQQQRVAIARALVFTPYILLLDEPLGALDRQLRAEVQIELKLLHAELGTTFVYVTHDQDEALSMSDRVVIFNRGKIEQAGTPTELYERPRTRFAAEFLGRSNCFAGAVTGRDGGATRLRVGGRTVIHQGAASTEQVLLALRPEKIGLHAGEPLDQENRSPGRLIAIAYLGAMLQAMVRTDAFGDVTASCLAWTAPSLAPGMDVWISWAPNATVLLDDDAQSTAPDRPARP